VSVFFLLLLKRRHGWAFVVLTAAFLARENTLLLCLLTGVWGGFRRSKELVYGSVITMVVGMSAGAWLVRLGQPNIHHLPDFVYLALKIPYNFLVNVFGVRIWSDVQPGYGDPFVRWALPSLLQIGNHKEIGLLVNVRLPIQTAMVLLTLFGCGPAFVRPLLKRAGGFRRWPFAVQLACVYGLISYLLGTSLGYATYRLIGYGWPLFWVALPFLLGQVSGQFRSLEAWLLMGCFLMVAWLPNVTGFWDLNRCYSLWLLLIPAVYGVVIWRLRLILTRPDVASQVAASQQI
jgi:hypothetical protein